MKYIASIIAFIILSTVAMAQNTYSVKLKWDAAVQDPGVTVLGYNLKKRVVINNVVTWELVASTTALTYTVSGLGTGEYTFAISAYNEREGDLSDPYTLQPVPKAPRNITAESVTITVTIPPQ